MNYPSFEEHQRMLQQVDKELATVGVEPFLSQKTYRPVGLFFSDESTLKEMIVKYVAWLETEVTLEVCKCDWEDKFPVPGGAAVKVLKGVNFECPLHTKEGMLLRFITWVKENG